MGIMVLSMFAAGPAVQSYFIQQAPGSSNLILSLNTSIVHLASRRRGCRRLHGQYDIHASVSPMARWIRARAWPGRRTGQLLSRAEDAGSEVGLTSPAPPYEFAQATLPRVACMSLVPKWAHVCLPTGIPYFMGQTPITL